MNHNNWRLFASRGDGDWRRFKNREFAYLVSSTQDVADKFGWSTWVGSDKNPYSITVSASFEEVEIKNISIRFTGAHNIYTVYYGSESNPNNISISSFKENLGTDVEGIINFISDYIEKVCSTNGKPLFLSEHTSNWNRYLYGTEGIKVKM